MPSREPKLTLQALSLQNKRLSRRVNQLERAVEALLERGSDYTENVPPFNHQQGRREIFDFLVSQIPFSSIIETGTRFGHTTAYMAANFDGPVYTSEILRQSFLIARERLKHFSNITIEHSDSRLFIQQLAGGTHTDQQTPLFYLDAHWEEDLPLAEEVQLIAENWKQFVILIDDFQVPDDPGYGFDDYGPGKALTLAYLQKPIETYQLDYYFPAIPAAEETGARRGCIALCQKGDLSTILRNSALLIAGNGV